MAAATLGLACLPLWAASLLPGARAEPRALRRPAAAAPDSWLGGPRPAFDRGALGRFLDRGHGDLMNTQVSRRRALVTDISMGTPAQGMRCLVDSGSADLWIPSKHCTSCDNEHYFRADRSSTFAPREVDTPLGRRPKPVKVSYGSGQVLGYDVQDTLQFGPVRVENQSFIIVEEAQLPPGRSWDGICGLGWKRLAQVDKPLYAHLQEMGREAVFSLVPKSRSRAAYMAVGEVPHEAVKPGTLVWAKNDPSDVRQGPAGGGQHSFWVASGGVAIRKKSPTPTKFLVDTGTNQVLLVPPKHYGSFMRSLLPADTFHRLCGSDPAMGSLVVCDCSIAREEGLPPLRVHLGGRAFPLSVSEMFLRVPAKDGGEELCLLQIQPNAMMAGLGLGGLGGLGGLLGGILGGLLGPGPALGVGSEGVGGGSPAGGSAGGGSPKGNATNGPDLLGDLLGKLLKGGLPGELSGGPFGPNASADAEHGMAGGVPPMPMFPGDLLGGPFRPNASADAEHGMAGGIPPMPMFPGDLLGGLLGPNASADAKHGMAGGIPPMPMSPSDLLGDAAGAATRAGVETKWIEEVKPDGSICTRTLEYKDGNLLKNVTKCTPPGGAADRRLQLLPQMGMPAMPATDPMEDVWVLGGVFLERYVTIFDFDNARIGFAEPVDRAPPLGPGLPAADTFLSKGAGEGSARWTWVAAPLAVLVGGASLVLVGLHVWRRRGKSSDSARYVYDRQVLHDAEPFE